MPSVRETNYLIRAACLLRRLLSACWLAPMLMVCPAIALGQSPLTTVMSKSKQPASQGFAALLAQCAAPKLPMELSAGISLESSTVVSDRLDGREIRLRSYRFNRLLDKVLPELERVGAVLHFNPPGDLRKQPVGTVWHGYNEMEGLEATRELSCSRIER